MKYPLKFSVSTKETERLEADLSGAETPERLLTLLDKFGVDWYVSEEGTLLVKYWQISAEDFVPPEKALVIRSNMPAPSQSNNLDWLSKNLENVRAEYGGRWVAIADERVVAAASDLSQLLSQISEYEEPFITFISPEPVIWTFTYAC